MRKTAAPLLFLAGISLLLPGCFRTRAEIAREKEEKEVRSNLQQSVVEYNQSLDRMQAEIGRLQGKIEELEHQRRKEMSTVSSSTEGNSRSVMELKTRVEELQKTQGVLFEEIKRLREENVQLLKTVSSRPAPAPEAPRNSKKNTSAGFESALTAYKAKDYEAAIEGFREFLQSSPRSKKAMDARFFLADSLYRQKDFDSAIVEFGAIHEKSPTSALGRKSTLRIAESFKALGKDKDAKAFAQILVQTSPDSPEAKQARKLLR